MFVVIVFCICMLNDVSLSRSRLLVNVEDLAALDSQVIEEKATLVDNIVRTTDCEGVKVFF